MLVRIIKSLADGSFTEKFCKTAAAFIERQLQNTWFLTSVPADHVGYGGGLLTWSRLQRHNKLRRKMHIAFLEYNHTKGRFGPLMTSWINERCQSCSASLNKRVEEADIIWVFSQDPLPDDARIMINDQINRARNVKRIINHPDHCNAYHQADAFEKMENAGVNVPRSGFSAWDIGKTTVVYKQAGMQGGDKSIDEYKGPVAGFSAYEFIDSRGDDGLYRRYRAYYIVGIVRPSRLMRCKQWNACMRNKPKLENTFEMTPEEIRQVRLIAQALKLDYFAVDYLRRAVDNKPFFTDVNIYPCIKVMGNNARESGYYCDWHTFDNRALLGIPEPGGKPFEEIFDNGMLSFMEGRSFPEDPDALN